MSGTDRLDSWKEIADYLRRSVRTAQRWEREAGLPVRRVSAAQSAVYAFREELDGWWWKHGDVSAIEAPTSSGAVAHLLPREHDATPVDLGTVSTRVQPFLSQEVRVDPDSAPGHAGLAVYFFTLSVMGLLHPDEGVSAVRAAAGRALKLDADNAEAHALQGVISALYDHDWAEGARRFARACQRERVPPTVRFHYASWFLSPLQRYHESLAEARLALVHEPLYLLSRVHIGAELCSLGEWEAGRAEFEHVIRIDPKFGPGLGHLGRELALRGDLAFANELSVRTYAEVPQHPNAAGFRAGMLARAGDRQGAEQVLRRLAHDGRWGVARARAEAHLVCCQFDEALDSIADAIAQRDPGIWILFAGTSGTRLRERPRWASIRTALGLPD